MPLIRWSTEKFISNLDDILEVYGSAMNYPDEIIRSRRGFLTEHAFRPGFRSVVTLDTAGTLVGFGYGYISSEGQWWHDQIKAVMMSDDYKLWMSDSFEVVELHVSPQSQGRGTGQRQLYALLEGIRNRTVILSTPEVPMESTRAWRLYRRLGFEDMVRDFYFPGDQRPFAILGRTLPLPLENAPNR